MSRIYVQTWRNTYLSVIPFGYLFEMSTAHNERTFRSEIESRQVVGFVAENGSGIVGFTTGGIERHSDVVYGAEIYTLYVLKQFQRRGIGALLVSALGDRFNQSSRYAMLVRVLKLNPYRRFYQKINGILIKSERLSLAGEMLELEVYGWLDTTLVCG
jgi:ribosomal protein S18 acetylase RimI-like enzyme